MKTSSYFLVTLVAGVPMLILSLNSNLVFSSTTENNTVLEQAMKSLEANQKKSATVSSEPVPKETQTAFQEITGSSMVQEVFFTWVIVSSDNELSVNLRYAGDGTAPPITVAATAITKSADGKSVTMSGNSVLPSGWASPLSLNVALNGDSSLYDATSINAVASPSVSSAPPSSPAVVQSTSPLSAASTLPLQSKTDFTNSNYALLFAKPDSYLDSKVDITGKVSNIVEPGVLQMYPGGGTNDAVVYYNETFNFIQDDCVKVTGVVREQFEGTNAFMATRVVPAVAAQTIDKVDCTQAIDPAAKTVVVEKSQIKAGIKIILHKVEFSDKNTRAYLTVDNTNPKASILFYDYNSKALQGKKQYSTTYSYDVDYPKIESDIPPGIEETGVVLFEPLDYNLPSARFQFEATRQENYASFDFVFPVTIPK
jgi:hypothetical protein